MAMVLVLEDDGCLHAYESLAAVTCAIEGWIAEDVLQVVIDERGQRYRIDWIRPDRKGVLCSYELVPDGPPDTIALVELIWNHRPVDAATAEAARLIEQRLR